MGPGEMQWAGRGCRRPCPGAYTRPLVQLNLSAWHGIRGARRGRVARVKRVPVGVEDVQGVFLGQTRLKLS